VDNYAEKKLGGAELKSSTLILFLSFSFLEYVHRREKQPSAAGKNLEP